MFLKYNQCKENIMMNVHDDNSLNPGMISGWITSTISSKWAWPRGGWRTLREGVIKKHPHRNQSHIPNIYFSLIFIYNKYLIVQQSTIVYQTLTFVIRNYVIRVWNIMLATSIGFWRWNKEECRFQVHKQAMMPPLH